GNGARRPCSPPPRPRYRGGVRRAPPVAPPSAARRHTSPAMGAMGRVNVHGRVVAAVVGLGLLTGACGRSSGGGGATSNAASEARWSEAQVNRLAGLQRNADLTYRLAAHPNCVANSLLRSGQEVRTYKNAGDVVATNPDGSVGVTIDDQTPACQQLF